MAGEITIYLMGENHTYPTASQASLNAMKQFHDNDIPMVYCDEMPSTMHLFERLEYIKQELESLFQLIHKYSFQDLFLTTDQELKPYFDISKKEVLKTRIQDLLVKLNDPKLEINVDVLVKDLQDLNAYQSLKNLLEFLSLNKISYVSIDIPDLKDKLLLPGGSRPKNKELSQRVAQYKEERIASMTHNILNKAVNLLSQTGGVILCGISAMHIAGLAKSLALNSQVKLNIVPMYCYSDPLANLSKAGFDDPEIISYFFRFSGNTISTNEDFEEMIGAEIAKRNAKPCTEITKTSAFDVHKTLKYTGAIAALSLFGLFCIKYASSAADEDKSLSPKPAF